MLLLVVVVVAAVVTAATVVPEAATITDIVVVYYDLACTLLPTSLPKQIATNLSSILRDYYYFLPARTPLYDIATIHLRN